MAFFLKKNIRFTPFDLLGFDPAELGFDIALNKGSYILNKKFGALGKQMCLSFWRIAADKEGSDKDIDNDRMKEILKKKEIKFEESHHILYNFPDSFEKSYWANCMEGMDKKNNHVLLEYPMDSVPDFDKLLFFVQALSYIPIVVLPFEAEAFSFNAQKLKIDRLLRKNCKFQVDYLSLTGHDGPDRKRVCDYLIKSNAVDFIGIDCGRWQELCKASDYKISKKTIELLEGSLLEKG